MTWPPEEGDVLARAKPWPLGQWVYFLIYDRRVTYVGWSTNPAARIRDHQNLYPFDSYAAYKFKTEFEARRAETMAIRSFKPPYNECRTARNAREGPEHMEAYTYRYTHRGLRRMVDRKAAT